MKNLYKIGILLRDASYEGGCKVVTNRLYNELLSNGYNVNLFSLYDVSEDGYISIGIHRKKRVSKLHVNMIAETIKKFRITHLIIQVDSPLSSIFSTKLLEEMNKFSSIFCVFHNSTASYFKVYHAVGENRLIYFARFLYYRCVNIPITKKRIICNEKFSHYICLSEESRRSLRDITSCDSDVIENVAPNIDNVCGYQKENICLYIGRVDSYQKNIHLLINSWICAERPDNWKLFIIGKGRETKRIKKVIKKCQACNISILNQLNQEEVMDYLKKSKLLLMSSNYEGLPTVVIEAMGNGNAIITTRFDGLDNSLLKNDVNCKIVGSNVQEYSKCIGMMLKDECKLKTIAQNAENKYKSMDNSEIILKWKIMLESNS